MNNTLSIFKIGVVIAALSFWQTAHALDDYDFPYVNDFESITSQHDDGTDKNPANDINGQADWNVLNDWGIVATHDAWTTYQGAFHLDNNTTGIDQQGHLADQIATLNGYINIPLDSVQPVLSYVFKLGLQDAEDAITVELQVEGSAGWTVLKTYYLQNNHADYSREEIDLSAYKGQNVTVRFVQQGYWLGGARLFVVDNFSIAELDLPLQAYPYSSSFETADEKSHWDLTSSWGVAGSHANWTSHVGSYHLDNNVDERDQYKYDRDIKATLNNWIPIPSNSQLPVLSYYYKVGLVSAADTIHVELQEQGSTNWTLLKTYDQQYARDSYTLERFSLDAYKGKNIRIRFRQLHFAANGARMFVVDDLNVADLSLGNFNYPYLNGFETPTEQQQWRSAGTWDITTDHNTDWSSRTGSFHLDNNRNAVDQGGQYKEHFAEMEGFVTIPAGSVHPVLSYDYKVNQLYWNDLVDVKLQIQGSGDWITLKTYRNQHNRTVYSREEIDLSTYKGQGIRIAFMQSGYWSAGTRLFVVDNVNIDEFQLPVLAYPYANAFDTAEQQQQWRSGGTWNISATQAGHTSNSGSYHLDNNPTAVDQAEHADGHFAVLQGQVEIPSNAIQPVLTYEYMLNLVAENDEIFIKVQTEGSTDWVQLRSYQPRHNRNSYNHEELSLAAYRGQKIRVGFFQKHFFNGVRQFLVDDLRIGDLQLPALGFPYQTSFDDPVRNDEWWLQGFWSIAGTHNSWTNTSEAYHLDGNAGELDLRLAIYGHTATLNGTVTIPATSQQPVVKFMHHLNMLGNEAAYYLEIQAQGADSWTVLKTYRNDITKGSDNTVGYIYQEFSLDAYKGQAVRVRLRQDNQWDNGASGWAIDDFSIIDLAGVSNQAPVANSQNISTPEDTAIAVLLTASDADGDNLSYQVLSQPAQGVLSGTAPNLIYQPSQNVNGTDSFTFVVNDGAVNSVVATVTINILPVNDAPVAYEQYISLNEDNAIAIMFGGVDPDGDALSYQIVTQPTNGSLTGSYPNLIYTPNQNFFGIDSIGYVANDGQLSSPETLVDISVISVNDAPVANAQNIVTNQNQSVAIVLTGSDIEGQALTYQIASVPSHGTITGVAPNIEYTPVLNFNGSDTFSFIVNDGISNSSPANVTLTVNAVNQAPVITSAPIRFAVENTPYQYQLIASDVEGDSFSFSLLQAPAAMAISAGTGEILWTPETTQIGDHSIVVAVTDSQGATGEQAYILTVSPAGNNTPQITSSPIASAVPGSVYLYSVTAIDSDGDALSYQLDLAPSGMAINGISGEITWSPVYADIGNHTVLVRVVDDKGAYTTQRFILNVQAGDNQPPVITSQGVLNASTGVLYTYQVTATDPDNNNLLYSLSQSPMGMIINPESGLVSWVPETNQTGSQQVTVVVDDMAGGTVSQIYAIDVVAGASNTAPQIVSTPSTAVNEDAVYVYDVSAVDSEHQDSLSYSLDLAPTGMTINAKTGSVVWLPEHALVQPIAAHNGACYAEASTASDIVVTKPWARAGVSYAPPVAVPLVDTNADGVVDTHDIPATIAIDNGALTAIRTDNGQVLWSITASSIGANSFDGTASVAVADIDYDGLFEIITVLKMSDSYERLFSLNNDGSLNWISVDVIVQRSADITIGDLTKDGQVEIVLGDKIFDRNGVLVFEAETSASIDAQGILGQQGMIIDLDLDGDNEILTGFHAYDHLGVELWYASGLTWLNSAPAFAVGNFDNDDYPEIVAVSGHHISLIQHDGTVPWGPIPFDIYTAPNSGGGGTPVIADFDHDGLDEIFVMGRTKGAMIDGDGSIVWQIDIDDSSSASVGATAFDLNNDGELEIIFTDEIAFYIVSSKDGRILYQDIDFNSGTLQEHPIVADLDGDGAAEILVTGATGLAMYESATTDWNWAPSLWTQSRYYPGVFSNLGQFNQDNHFWLTGIGFSVNNAITTPLADITAQDLRYDSANSRITATVSNRGLADIDTAFNVGLYAGDPQVNGQLIGETTVGPVAAGASQQISIDNIVLDANTNLYLHLDTQGALSECDLSNNSIAASYVRLKVEDVYGLSDQQSYLVNVLPSNRAPIIVSLPTSEVTANDLYQYYIAIDDNLGDVHSYSLIGAPVGMQVKQSTGTLLWRTSETDAGTHNFILRVTDAGGLTVDQSITVNVSADPNLPPVIQQPVLQTAYIEQAYNFTIIATDPDGDSTAIVYELWGEPVGMTVNASTGLVDWYPLTTDIGEHRFLIAARDAGGRVSSLEVSVIVGNGGAVNQAPIITSTPIASLLAGFDYSYQIDASDAENDALVYQLVSAPAGMSVDATGLVSWPGTTAQIGLYPVVIQVNDSYGNYATQSYSLVVSASTGFSIVSTPNTVANIDTPYNYALSISGENISNLILSLVQAPATMSISPQGVINWLPSASDAGVHSVQIEVSNVYGDTAIQVYNLLVEQVLTNAPPVYSGQPVVQAVAEVPYSYQVVATDPDGDNLSYTLLNAPLGMGMDSNGLITWTPGLFDIGSYEVSFQISDGINTLDVSYVIVVDQTLPPIVINILVEPQIVDPGENVTVTVQASGGYGAITSNLSIDGQPVNLVNNQAVISSSIIGRHDIHVASSAGGDTELAGSYFSVRDINDTSAPQVYIVSPASGTTITSPTDIIGIVQDDNLANVLLAARRKGESDYITLYEGADAFNMGLIGAFDPTLLVNGIYEIFVIATDVNGQQSSTLVNTIVEGNLKVGHFSFTVEDLNIPLAGIPVRITRTYDSRRKHENLDFGYGWSIDYQNIRVEESVEPSMHWYRTTEDMPFIVNGSPLNAGATCVRSTVDKFVTVTLPNGDVERFTVHAEPANASPASVADPECHLVPDSYFNIVFEAQSGTYSTLASADGSSLYLNASGNLAYIDDNTPVPVNRYTLTTREGFVYQLNQQFGIETVSDPNGNTITFSENGIVHSSGKSISFARDANGRIINVTDPENNVIRYSYSRAGDLRNVTDAMDNVTDYSYYANHYLEDINDSLGRRLLRNIYDTDGRLIAQEDNNGARTDFNHDVAGRLSIITNRRGYSTQFVYDDRGNVLSQTDALGYTTSFSYDNDDNQLSKTDPLLHTSSATYNAAGDQLTQADALGNTVTYTYNDRGQELTVTDALQRVFTNTYDAYGNLRSIEDPLLRSSTVDIGTQGLPSRVVDASGAETTFTYDGFGNKLTETNHLGHTTTYTYDDNGNVLTESRLRTVDGIQQTEVTSYVYDRLNRLIQTTDALGNVTRQVYDEFGNKVQGIDALDRVTQYTYDAYRRLTRIDYPDSSFSQKDYDAEGNLISETDRDGHTTTYSYDELNRRVRTTYADSSYSETVYDAAGRVIAEIDANGNRTEHEYDAADRRILTRDALGRETTFGYDANGNLTRQTDANAHTTTFVYDELDNRVRTVYPDATESTQSYDAMGRVTSKTDQNGYTTNYVYDGIGQLVQVSDAQLGIDQGHTYYSYDETGNKLSQTDAEGRVTRWTYDALGRELSRTLPLLQVETFTYNTVGDRTSHTDFNGQLTGYQYDSNHRAGRIDYADLTFESFSYNNEGQRTAATARDGVSQSWSYDNRGRLAWTTSANGDRLDYGYDNVGNRTSLTVTPSGGTADVTSYTYDALNRLSSVTDSSVQVTGYGYDLVGNRNSVSYPNGNVTSYVYDSLNRLTRQTTVDSLATVLTDYQYTLDNSGHRLQISEASGRVTDYTYDRLHRLLTETVTDSVNGNYTASYSYDRVGNRSYSIIDGVQTAYTYDDNDRLTQQGGTTYVYDNNGNTISETLDGNTDTYSYNVKNELIGSTKGSVTSSYAYDIDGIRTQKTEDSISTSYLVDHNRDYAQVIKEITGTNSVEYLYGDDLIRQNRNGAESYYLYDGLGSTRALTDNAGAVTDSYDYEAFGDVLNQTGTTENSYRFTGEQYDGNLDNYYLRARYYDPNRGRFTQMDTWMGNNQDPVTLHKYLYANVNPVDNIDPSGNFTMASLSVAMNIRTELAATQADVGFNLLDAAINPDAYGEDAVANSALSVGLAALGPVSFKLLKMLSSKFRKTCNSFDGDTEVWTQNGPKLISDITIGEKVWAFDEENGKFELRDVVHLVQRKGDYDLIKVSLDDGSVDATSNHPFYVNTDDKWTWKDANKIRVGDIVLDRDNNERIVRKIEVRPYKGGVFNLTVDRNHTYLVGSEGIVVHNVQKICPLEGLIVGAEKPAYIVNRKHTRGGGGKKGGSPAGLLPQDAEYAFLKLSVKSENGNWYAKSSDGGAIYRYFEDQGSVHWSGSTSDLKAPLSFQSIPAAVRRALGFKPNGKKM